MPNSEHCLGTYALACMPVNASGIMPTQVLPFISESLLSLAQAYDHRPKAVLRGETPRVLTVASSRSAGHRHKELIGGPKPGGCPGPGQAAAVGTRRAGRRCLPRGASSSMRQGVTDTRCSLIVLADYPSETAQVTGTERLTLPSPAGRSRRFRFAGCPLGFAQRTRFQRYGERLVRPSRRSVPCAPRSVRS